MSFERSEALLSEYEKYILPIIKFEPSIAETGSGSYIIDVDGNRILDLNAGQFCSIFGHSNGALTSLMEEVSSTLQHTNTATLSLEALRALKSLHEISPGMEGQSIILSTGAEAVEFALRFAKFATGKMGIVCFEKGYHGLTLAAQAATYGGIYSNPPHPGVHSLRVPTPDDPDEQDDVAAEQFRRICESDRNIACALFEPIVSVGGIYVQRPKFFRKVRQICDEHDIVLIFDECQTGFGRTGSWYYFQQLECIPDIVVSAKGLGLGYPVSAVTVAGKMAERKPPHYTHFSSHQNDPFAAAVINFGLRYIMENELLVRVRETGQLLFDRLEKLHDKYPIISPPRGAGLMLGFDMVIPGVTDYRTTTPALKAELLNHGVMIQTTNGGQTFRCLPNYLITPSEIDEFISALDESLDSFAESNRIGEL